MVYQLSLNNIHDSCSHWISQNIKEKVNDVNSVVIRNLQRLCNNNNIKESNICDDYHGYTCQNNADNHVIYNVHLVTTPEVTTTELVECFNLWLNTSPKIQVVVNGIELSLNKECTGIIDAAGKCFPVLLLNDITTVRFLANRVEADKERAGVLETDSEFKCPTSSSLDLGTGLAVGFGVSLLVVLTVVLIIVGIVKKW